MGDNKIVMARHLATNVVPAGSGHVFDKTVRRDHLIRVVCHVFEPLHQYTVTFTAVMESILISVIFNNKY